MSENEQVHVVTTLPPKEEKNKSLKSVVKKTLIATAVVGAGAFIATRFKGKSDSTEQEPVTAETNATIDLTT